MCGMGHFVCKVSLVTGYCGRSECKIWTRSIELLHKCPSVFATATSTPLFFVLKLTVDVNKCFRFFVLSFSD